MKTGIELIADERNRQIESEGFDSKHDENNSTADLISAAIAYLESAKIASICGEEFSEDSRISAMKVNWPKWWDKSWIKPGTVDRDLEKAGALVAAALDRFNKDRK